MRRGWQWEYRILLEMLVHRQSKCRWIQHETLMIVLEFTAFNYFDIDMPRSSTNFCVFRNRRKVAMKLPRQNTY